MIRSVIATVGAVLACQAATANSAEVKTDSTITYVIVSNAEQKVKDTTVYRLLAKGIINAADPSSPFHLMSQDCFETVVIGAKGNVADGGGYCDSWDRDGDSFRNWWNFTADGSSKWEVIHGTGKFEGLTGGGTCKPLVNFPDRFTLGCQGTAMMK
ncbi:hypothetical protein [Aestuariivirga sp.]|uniref:hypothetical protein n=1 Tax=Aestuariivirga sp. TaxID=2650926 RepID=UPI003918A8BE